MWPEQMMLSDSSSYDGSWHLAKALANSLYNSYPTWTAFRSTLIWKYITEVYRNDTYDIDPYLLSHTIITPRRNGSSTCQVDLDTYPKNCSTFTELHKDRYIKKCIYMAFNEQSQPTCIFSSVFRRLLREHVRSPRTFGNQCLVEIPT